MNVRFNRRLLGSAAGTHREIGDAIRVIRLVCKRGKRARLRLRPERFRRN